MEKHSPTEQKALESAAQLLMLTLEMNGVLEEEMPLIEKRNVTAHSELLKRKQEIALRYSAAIKKLATERDAMSALPDLEKNMLRAAGRKLEETASRNAKALYLANVGMQKLMDIIVKDVSSQVRPSHSYAGVMKVGRGSISNGEHSYGQTHAGSTPPVAINQKI